MPIVNTLHASSKQDHINQSQDWKASLEPLLPPASLSLSRTWMLHNSKGLSHVKINMFCKLWNNHKNIQATYKDHWTKQATASKHFFKPHDSVHILSMCSLREAGGQGGQGGGGGGRGRFFGHGWTKALLLDWLEAALPPTTTGLAFAAGGYFCTSEGARSSLEVSDESRAAAGMHLSPRAIWRRAWTNRS